MKYIISILVTLLFKTAIAQNILIVRVCNSGTNNTIFWQEGSDTCIKYGTLSLWARENISTDFYKLDSNLSASAKTYSHINANVPAIKNWQYKIEFQKICSGDTSAYFTDSIVIDDIKPDSSILDSVSINPITNQVIIGWTSNKTKDFASYYLYNSDRTDPRLAENYTDTFFIDNNPINPKTKSLTYDITSSDSCDNRRDYGKYFHQSIWLRASIDTCLNEARLIWTKYVGWEPIKHYIFRRINAGPFELIHETTDINLQYTDKNLPINSTVEYFVRAHAIFSSSSNLSFGIRTGSSRNPFDTEIEVVTANMDKHIKIIARPNPLSDYNELVVEKRINGIFDSIGLINLNTFEFIDKSAFDNQEHNYRLVSKNACRYYSDTTSVSRNIVLGLVRENNKTRLNWSNYFTWNNAIENHTIYRATGDNIGQATNFVALNSQIKDTFFIDKEIINLPAQCYYIETKESITGVVSRSNTVCTAQTGEIFYPNAIVIGGINNVFTFLGKSIELDKSKINIYDRWGNQIYTSDNISNGWNGIDANNNTVMQGVYFFIAQIKRNEEIITLKGNINVIY